MKKIFCVFICILIFFSCSCFAFASSTDFYIDKSFSPFVQLAPGMPLYIFHLDFLLGLFDTDLSGYDIQFYCGTNKLINGNTYPDAINLDVINFTLFDVTYYIYFGLYPGEIIHFEPVIPTPSDLSIFDTFPTLFLTLKIFSNFIVNDNVLFPILICSFLVFVILLFRKILRFTV